MHRDIESLSSQTFDVLVIGGGILGACVAWDAATRGIRVALVEKGDFACGTSSNSLKIVHGGLRYLQHLDLRRMRESIRERSTWLRIAPHLVEPLPIVVPTHGLGLRSRPILRTALAVSDVIGWDRNHDLEPERRIPAGRALSRHECLELVPELEAPSVTGGVLFYDAQMYSAERLVLEVVQAATNAGAVVANYAELEGPLMRAGGLAGAKVTERITGEQIEVRASTLVNAAGPGVPAVASRLSGRPHAAATRYSVALNLLVDGLGHGVAFALAGRSHDPNVLLHGGARQLFVVPWRGQSIVGTAHYPYDGDPADFRCDECHVERFLNEINDAWPAGQFARADVRLVHSGLLPVEARATAHSVRLLKRHRVLDHARDGIPEVISAVSVKFTTARLVAEETVDLVFRKLGRRPPPCLTSRTRLPGTPSTTVSALVALAEARHGGIVGRETLHHLVRAYGANYERVLACRDVISAWNEPILDTAPVIRAQLAYGARAEMAQEPEDLLDRRTELGSRGLSSEVAAAAAAGVLHELKSRSK